MTPEDLKAMVRSVPDFPAPGILFRDVTTLIGHGRACLPPSGIWPPAPGQRRRDDRRHGSARLHLRRGGSGACGIGFVPVRKPGKLPVPTIGVDYELEYGTDRLEIDPTAIRRASTSPSSTT
jgi:adenine phosphoribosyltransferase